ncbi:MAG TPA: hypothetical protein VFF28_02595 [Candidatus Nanoarchaeia archaeon]|nr:hypothetical protein [Candidatus Nanoarchaeia archaeon]
MGQQEVYNILKKYRRKWLSSRDIVKLLRSSPGSVITSLQKLRKGDVINFKLERQKGQSVKRRVYVYKYKK